MTRTQIDMADVEAAARLLLGDHIGLADENGGMFTYEAADGRSVTICVGAPDAVWQARQAAIALDPLASIFGTAAVEQASKVQLPNVTEEYKGFQVSTTRMPGPDHPGGRKWYWFVRQLRDGKWSSLDAGDQPCATSEAAIKRAKRQVDTKLIPADEARAAHR